MKNQPEISDSRNYGSGTLNVIMPDSYSINGSMTTTSPLPMIAYNSGSSLQFKHVGSVFRLTLTGVPAGTKTITVMTDQQISGTFLISGQAQDNTMTPSMPATDLTGTSLNNNKITYTLGTALTVETDLVLNVPLPTGTFHTLTVCAYDASSNLKSKGYNDFNRIMARAQGRKLTVDMAAGTYLFGGFRIAPGNLYYDGSAFKVADTWKETSYGSKYGLTEGSFYFYWVQASRAFDAQAPLATNTANDVMDNMASGSPCYSGTGWLIVTDETNTTASYPSTSPATTTWAKILTTDKNVRAGSNVNGSANKHYARIKVSDYTYSGNSTPEGCLIFPDDKTITGQSLTGSVDAWSSATSLTTAQLDAYISQGCVFLPAAGYAISSGSWYYGGTNGVYWSATTNSSDTSYAYDLYFGSNGHWGASGGNIKAYGYYSVRPVR